MRITGVHICYPLCTRPRTVGLARENEVAVAWVVNLLHCFKGNGVTIVTSWLETSNNPVKVNNSHKLEVRLEPQEVRPANTARNMEKEHLFNVSYKKRV